MANSTSNWWQYSRWTYIIGRTLRFNGPRNAGERTAVETFITYFKTSRPWLLSKFRMKADQPVAGGDPLSINQPDDVDSKIVMVIGRDLKKIPMTTAEKPQVDTLIAATSNRRYGEYGNLI